METRDEGRSSKTTKRFLTCAAEVGRDWRVSKNLFSEVTSCSTNEQHGGGNIDKTGPTDVSGAGRSGEEEGAGDVREVRRFNNGTPDQFARGCRWKGKDRAGKPGGRKGKSKDGGSKGAGQ